MNQSILIVDTPDCCENCLCLGGFIRAYAMCRAKARLINDPYKKPGWCPLIPYREEKENGVCEEMRQMWKVI